jgi:predicted nucleic acid-binding protein
MKKALLDTNILSYFLRGNPIDLFIAATAIYCDYNLVTANVKHFQNIPKLIFEDWSL